MCMHVLSVNAFFPLFMNLQAAKMDILGVGSWSMTSSWVFSSRRISGFLLRTVCEYRDMDRSLKSLVLALLGLHLAFLFPAGERGPWAHSSSLDTALLLCQWPLAMKVHFQQENIPNHRIVSLHLTYLYKPEARQVSEGKFPLLPSYY